MVKPSASVPNGPLDSLVDLACRDGVEIRPTLLRVITDLYVQKPSHSQEEEDQYVELALGLIDAVDPLTRGTVTATLSAYKGAPEMVLRKLASLPLASRRGDAPGDDLIELFFDANTDERRLILTNLDVTADAATLRPMPAESELMRRLERAARERNSGEFARVLERALGVSRELATRITRDPFGEPLVVAGKALGMSADMLQRILLCLNPVIGQSVERVFELAILFEDLNAAAVHRMLTIWRAEAAQRHVVMRGAAPAVSQSSPLAASPAGTATPTSAHSRAPVYARSASFDGFQSAEARSAKAESGNPRAAHARPSALDPRFRGDERESVNRTSSSASAFASGSTSSDASGAASRDASGAGSSSTGASTPAPVSARPRASGDPGAAHSKPAPLDPRFGVEKDAVLRTAMHGDEREKVHRSSHEPVYWDDERRSARQSAARTPGRGPAEREARPFSKKA